MLAKYAVMLVVVVSSLALGPSSAFAEAVVPIGLEGQSSLAATVALEAEGFRVTLREEPSCVAAPGLVSRVNPLGGTVVTADPPRVDLYISVGGVDDANAAIVPPVVGKPFAVASQALSQVGLEAIDIKFTTEGKGKCPVKVGQPKLIDSVVDVNPGVGVRLCRGTKVRVIREIYQQWKETPKNKACD